MNLINSNNLDEFNLSCWNTRDSLIECINISLTTYFNSNKIHPNHLKNSGFTLIEVIVSMIIVSMITMIMAFTFKVNLQAWERGVEEGDKIQIKVILPNMIERQLRYMVTSASLQSSDSLTSENSKKDLTSIGSKAMDANTPISQMGTMTQLKFIGKENTFSFYTIYSPEGTSSKGLIRVSYIYDKDAKELSIYENVITNEDDIKNSNELSSSSSKKSNYQTFGRSRKSDRKSKRKSLVDNTPVSTIKDVESFSLSFLSEEDLNVFNADNSHYSSTASKKTAFSRSSSNFKMNGSSFEDSWDEDAANPPGFIRISFAQTNLKRGASSVWLFKVGGKI